MEPLPLPDPLDFGGVLGTMYVLESSRLGAMALLNLVQRSNEPTVLCATAYLRHGAGHDFWQSFLTALESHSATLHESGAIDGAVRPSRCSNGLPRVRFGPPPRPQRRKAGKQQGGDAGLATPLPLR